MALKTSKTIRWILLGLTALSIGVKLFTVEVHSSDDPSIYLVLSGKPVLVNRLIANDLPKGFLLLEDENGYPGIDAYAFFVAWGWLIAPTALALTFLNRFNRIRHL